MPQDTTTEGLVTTEAGNRFYIDEAGNVSFPVVSDEEHEAFMAQWMGWIGAEAE